MQVSFLFSDPISKKSKEKNFEKKVIDLWSITTRETKPELALLVFTKSAPRTFCLFTHDFRAKKIREEKI